jgi:hypothetical protein
MSESDPNIQDDIDMVDINMDEFTSEDFTAEERAQIEKMTKE